MALPNSGLARAERAADNRLRAALQCAFATVPDGWAHLTDSFLASDTGARLCGFVDERVAAGAAVYPSEVFHALTLTPRSEVRVVVLGQDPYHGAGQAQGLAFSVASGQKVPPSLRNLLQEVRADTGEAPRCRDDLTPWARQGVLMLNSVLTVEEAAPTSHAGRGWEVLTDALLSDLAAQAEPVVFVLWGASAQKKRPLLEGAAHRVLIANHPSPLSAARPPLPFLGCRHFSQVNDFLRAHRRGPPIVW